jgi:hypothetical protein
MKEIGTDNQRGVAIEIAFRQRALAVNRGIYSRRYGPDLLPRLAGAGQLRARYIAELARLEAEKHWGSSDSRRLAELARDIRRLGRLRADIAGTCIWHADRMGELVHQHEALARLERMHRPRLVWSQQVSAEKQHPRARKRARGRRRRA